MCLQPKVIINPTFVKMSSFGKYPCIHMPGRDFLYTRNVLDDFDYRLFSVRRNGVNSNNLSDFYSFNESGEVLPLYLEVPCGHCSSCIMRKKNDYKNKLILEQSCHNCPPLFLTLTYNDENLPEDGVSVKDVQLFLKRWRSYIDYHHPESIRFRYVCHSEYSPEKGRPHYHLLIFGFSISPRDLMKVQSEIEECWNKGFVYVRLCDHGCFNYVSKYICKGSNVPFKKEPLSPRLDYGFGVNHMLDDKPKYVRCNPNFRLSSRGNGGLGVPAFDDDSLYFRLLQSPHPLITVKCLGRVFEVFVPKSIRERLCRSPRQFIPPKVATIFKGFCHKCALLRVAMDDVPEFASHVDKVCSLEGVLSPQDSIVPRPIYDKFAALEFCPVNLKVPHYIRSDIKFSRPARNRLLDDYVKIYKYLDDFYLDFGKMYHFTYLRGTVYERWKLSLIQFSEMNPDSDPLSVSKFNAIQVELQKFDHPA